LRKSEKKIYANFDSKIKGAPYIRINTVNHFKNTFSLLKLRPGLQSFFEFLENQERVFHNCRDETVFVKAVQPLQRISSVSLIQQSSSKRKVTL